MESVAVNNVEIEKYGFAVHEIRGWLNLPMTTYATQRVAGVPGMVRVATPPEIEPRELRVRCSLSPATLLERRQLLATFVLAAQGEIEVTVADDPNRVSYCLVTDGSGQGITPQSMLEPGAMMEIVFMAHDPYYYQKSPSTYVLPPSTRVAVPVASAAVRGLVYVNGGGSGSGTIGLRLRLQTGEILNDMTLDNVATVAALGALVVAAEDTVLFDCQNYTILQYDASASAWVDIFAYLKDGQDFLKFDPKDAPTLEILNGYDGWGVHRKADLV